MTGILLTVGSIGVMCVSGVAVSTVLTWLHEFEFNVNKKSSKERPTRGGGMEHDRFDAFSKGLKGRN